MPAIKDWSYNYHSTTTATTIVVEVPTYTEGDLLLAILSTDTGTTQAWSCTGWTQLFSQSNGPNLGLMYKVAGASEPNDYTFTYTIAETANGIIVSIQDVDVSNLPSSAFPDYDIANCTSANQAMPVSVATRSNTLVLYCSTHPSVAVVPSILEGPVIQVISKDGSAHSDSFAWTFMPSLGNSPNNVYSSVTGTTYTGVLATILINPPSTGATVIPTYCASDLSIYIDPIHGVTAYNGNTAFAGTALTYWATPLAGRTLANATASVKADYGINTYRSCGGMTGPVTANTYTGATTVLLDANRVNITGKNILVHAMPLLPADLQTVYDVGLEKGVEVGMASSLNNGKVWHIHGFGTPWGIKRVPIVINEGNTSGVIDTRGTFDKTLTKIFGFFTCGFLVSSDWTWTMIWLLDTTVVAGGNSSKPVDILGIVTSVADGHERISAIQQAANQMLLLQPIQIGNGGTNPVYLDLNSTAIEFPEIYNLTKKQIYYCSAPNAAGITYYAGASDTIKHRNSIISSPSRYFWGLNASSSLSATYDFSGLSVIGAGTITLARAITITGLTINDYTTIDASGLTLTNSTIKGVPTSNDSITLTTASNIDDCTVDVTGVSSANRWCSVADPTIFSYSTFTGSASTGHAMRLTTTGSYSIYGLVFNSFGADGTNSAAIFNDSGGLVTLTILGGGSTPTIRNGAGASTTVVAGTVNVTVTVKNSATPPVAIENARVLVLAASGGPMPYDVTVTITRSGSTATVTHTAHGMATSDKVQIKGAVQQEYNGVYTIIKIDNDSYSYTVSGTPATPATGTIKATYVALSGLTNASGVITMSRVFSTSQPISGRVRKSTGTPIYKTSDLIGTIDSGSGFATTIQLISDE